MRQSLTFVSFGLLIFTVLDTCHLSQASEVLHTIHETPSVHCTNLADIVEEDSFTMFDEVLNCEI